MQEMCDAVVYCIRLYRYYECSYCSCQQFNAAGCSRADCFKDCVDRGHGLVAEEHNVVHLFVLCNVVFGVGIVEEPDSKDVRRWACNSVEHGRIAKAISQDKRVRAAVLIRRHGQLRSDASDDPLRAPAAAPP